jgi:hypothetical protein
MAMGARSSDLRTFFAKASEGAWSVRDPAERINPCLLSLAAIGRTEQPTGSIAQFIAHLVQLFHRVRLGGPFQKSFRPAHRPPARYGGRQLRAGAVFLDTSPYLITDLYEPALTASP